MQQTTLKKGLSGFALKYLGMALMVLDHIEYFFAYTGKIPLFFSMLGRLAAPLFLFCLIEGFTHTRDRKKYFLRIYLLSVLMGAVQFSFYNIGYALVRPDGFFPQNQMLASFSILIVILQGFDWCARKKWGRGLAAILIPLLLPIVTVFSESSGFYPAAAPHLYHGRRYCHPVFRSDPVFVPQKQKASGGSLCYRLYPLGHCTAPSYGAGSCRQGLFHNSL